MCRYGGPTVNPERQNKDCWLLVVSGWGQGEMEEKLLNGLGVLLWSDDNVLKLDKGGGCTL